MSSFHFNHHEVIPQHTAGIYHIAMAIFHISAGNISLSPLGKYHWQLRKSLSATDFPVGAFVVGISHKSGVETDMVLPGRRGVVPYGF